MDTGQEMTESIFNKVNEIVNSKSQTELIRQFYPTLEWTLKHLSSSQGDNAVWFKNEVEDIYEKEDIFRLVCLSFVQINLMSALKQMSKYVAMASESSEDNLKSIRKMYQDVVYYKKDGGSRVRVT